MRFIDGLGRTSKIKIDARCPQSLGDLCVSGHEIGVTAQQLHKYGSAGGGATVGQQLRAESIKDSGWQHGLRNAHKLCDTSLVAAYFSEEIAHDALDHPFHRSEHQTLPC